MAGGDASQVPAALDPSWVNRKFEAIEQWQREMMPSVAQTVTQIVAERTLNTVGSGSALIGNPPLVAGPMTCPSFDGSTVSVPSNAVNIIVSGVMSWTHGIAATGDGTASGTILYDQLSTTGKRGRVSIAFGGTITSGYINVLRFPFTFAALSPVELAQMGVGMTLSIAGATFNAADYDRVEARAVVTYGLA